MRPVDPHFADQVALQSDESHEHCQSECRGAEEGAGVVGEAEGVEEVDEQDGDGEEGGCGGVRCGSSGDGEGEVEGENREGEGGEKGCGGIASVEVDRFAACPEEADKDQGGEIG